MIFSPSYLGGTNSDSGFFLTHSHKPVSMPHVPTHKPCDKPTVQKEFETKAGDVMEVDESDDEEEGKEELTTKQVMEMCQQMEGLCIKHGSFKGSLNLAKHI